MRQWLKASSGRRAPVERLTARQAEASRLRRSTSRSTSPAEDPAARHSGLLAPGQVVGAGRAARPLLHRRPGCAGTAGPDAPDQALLVDMPGRRAYFFCIEIWPQEVYYLAGLLILGAIGLFLVTALFGRVWCGFTCPQTVWTDLFMWVERKIEGDRNARIRLDKAPLSPREGRASASPSTPPGCSSPSPPAAPGSCTSTTRRR